MPAATPASIRPWMGRYSGWGRAAGPASGLVVFWSLVCAVAVVVSMPPACRGERALGIGKTHHPTLTPGRANQGLPR